VTVALQVVRVVDITLFCAKRANPKTFCALPGALPSL
jgi:hypothetical protein